MKKFLFFAALALTLAACSDDETPVTPPAPPTVVGTYVLNQGNMYNGIAGSLGYIDDQSSSYTADVFGPANGGKQLGDTPQQAIIYGSHLYIAVYASNLVWVTDAATGKVQAQLTTTEPEALAAADGKVFVANNDGKVSVIDTLNLAIKSTIAVGPNPASLCAVGKTVYCAISDGYNYANGYADGFRVAVIDAEMMLKVKDIAVGMNPTCLKADGLGNVFCVCMGDYGTTLPKVWKISALRSAPFCDGSIIAAHDNTLYVINSVTTYDDNWQVVGTHTDYNAYDTTSGEQRTFSIAEADRPAQPIAMAVRPDGTLYITSDAALYDYNSPGYVHLYSTDGRRLKTYNVGTHPYDLVFCAK